MRSQQGKRVDFPARTCFCAHVCAHVCASACASCFCVHSITVLQAIYKPASRASKESSKEYTTQCEYIMNIALESNSQADSRTRLPCVRACVYKPGYMLGLYARLNPGLCWRSAPCSQSPTDCMSSHQPSVYAARSINGKMQSQKVWPEFLPYHPYSFTFSEFVEFHLRSSCRFFGPLLSLCCLWLLGYVVPI